MLERASHRPLAKLAKILDLLQICYGKPKPPQLTDPYEMLLHRNAGYPQSDDLCDKGFLALQAAIGLEPEKILAAPAAKLREAMRGSGMKPELRARRLKEIAARILDEFSGDLRAALRRSPAKARAALKQFSTVGDSTAEKILLFAKIAPVAALPSNCIHVPLRLGLGADPALAQPNWSRAYRSAQEAIAAQLPENFPARLRAYQLLKTHGQQTCKLANPLCDDCPVSRVCPFYLHQPLF
ncbi:MAG: hypothetical protein WBE43_14755 [Candidatus Acidiferrales bacterium]